jgi:hypothetical protein
MTETNSRVEGTDPSSKLSYDPVKEAMRIADLTVNAMHSQTEVVSLLSWIMIVDLIFSMISMVVLIVICIALFNGVIK